MDKTTINISLKDYLDDRFDEIHNSLKEIKDFNEETRSKLEHLNTFNANCPRIEVNTLLQETQLIRTLTKNKWLVVFMIIGFFAFGIFEILSLFIHLKI